MKLKELVNNTLPRTKRHKRHKQHNSADERSPISEPTRNNGVTQTETADSDFKISYWLNPNYAEVNQGISCGPKLRIPEFVCGTSYCDTTVCSYNSSPDEFPFDCIHYDSDGAYTLPKERSKIKTNPWLPSPKTSPTTSGVISPLHNVCDSSNEAAVFNFGRHYFPSMREYNPQNNTSMSESGFYSLGTPEVCPEFVPSLGIHVQQDKPRHELVLNLGDKQKKYGTTDSESGISFDYEEDFEAKLEVCSSGAFGSRDDVSDIFASRTTLHACSDSTSLYPADTSASESCDFQQSCDYLNSESCDYLNQSISGLSDCVFDEDLMNEKTASKHYLVNPFDGTYIPVPSHDHKGFNVALTHSKHAYQTDQESVNDEQNPRLKYLEHLNRLHPVKSSQIQMSHNDRKYSVNSQDDDDDESDNFPAYDYSQYLQKSPSKVDKVRNGLYDKIRQLRHEKLRVDDLVRRAREEEELKRQARMRIQQEATHAMKQVLLGTLRDLKEKLESQTDRLQDAYEQVLAMQHEEVRNQRRAQENIASGFHFNDCIGS